MSLAGGGCPLSYPSRGNVSMSAMSVSKITNSTCSHFHAVSGAACSQQLMHKECKSIDVKETSSVSFVPKPYSNGTLVAAASSLQNPAVVLYPREKICVNWHEAIPKREPVGLWNAGNSCFLNSVLQCLTFTPPLANYFMFEGHKKDILCPEQCIMCNMQRHIVTSFTTASRTLKPFAILDRLQAIARHMERYKQEDAHEFLRCLVDAMQKRLLINLNHLDHFSQETSLLHQIFGGYLRSQVVCDSCKAVSNTYETFLDISLEVKDVSSLQQALDAYTRREILDKENSYHCESCQKKVRAYKRFMIHRPPNVLTLQLKRYVGGGTGYKLNRHLNFPLQLDLRPFVTEVNDASVMYRLYAVLVHYGMTTTSGHYYCCVLSPSGHWYKMNDATVMSVSHLDVLREEAYMLFYVRHPKLTTANDCSVTAGKMATPTRSFLPNHSVQPPVHSAAGLGMKSNVLPVQKLQPVNSSNAVKSVVTTSSAVRPQLTAVAVAVKPLLTTSTCTSTPAATTHHTGDQNRTPLQSSDNRQKISFRWNNRVFPAGSLVVASKSAEQQLSNSSKLVPYEDDLSDESEMEKETVKTLESSHVTMDQTNYNDVGHPENTCPVSPVSVLNGEADNVLSTGDAEKLCEPAEPTVVTSTSMDNKVSGCIESLSLLSDNKSDATLVLSSVSSSCPVSVPEVETVESEKEVATLLSITEEHSSTVHTDVASAADTADQLKNGHLSADDKAVSTAVAGRKRHGKHKSKQRHAKHRRYSVSKYHSSDDEVEYIWVEKTAKTLSQPLTVLSTYYHGDVRDDVLACAVQHDVQSHSAMKPRQLQNDTSHFISDENGRCDKNCTSMHDRSAEDGDANSIDHSRNQSNSRSRKCEPHNSALYNGHSGSDSWTDAKYDRRSRSVSRWHGTRTVSGEGSGQQQSSSLRHDTAGRRHYSDARPAHSHHHHDWSVSPDRWQHRRHVYGRHKDSDRHHRDSDDSRKHRHYDKRSGHSARRSPSGDRRHHRDWHRKSSHGSSSHHRRRHYSHR